MRFLKKIFRRLNAIEKIALVLSFFYGLGVISLIQFNAYYTGGECLDFLRIKPILVGLQYFAYLALPAVAFGVPISFFKKVKGLSCYLKILLAVVICVVLMITTGVMFHYFIPFTYNITSESEVCFYWTAACQFWGMYFYWDFFHVIGMGLIIYFSWIAVFRRHSFWKRYNIWLLVLCSVMNLFYFNKDVYVNIVQSAGGGAPRAGIITIRNPSECMKRLNADYCLGDNEITKPCFILEENNDHFIVADMFSNYYNRHIMSEADMRASATRIDRDSVKQFSAINYFLGFKNADSHKFKERLNRDVINHLEVVLNLCLVPISSSAQEDWKIPFYNNVTNDMRLSWWDEDGGVLSAQSRRVHVGLKGGTNLVQQIVFSGVEFPCGVYVWSMEHKLKWIKNRIRIDHLPVIPDGYKYSSAQLIFVCNFIYSVLLTCNASIGENGSLLIETEAAGLHKKGKK